jgi:hypothetical protein
VAIYHQKKETIFVSFFVLEEMTVYLEYALNSQKDQWVSSMN